MGEGVRTPKSLGLSLLGLVLLSFSVHLSASFDLTCVQDTIDTPTFYYVGTWSANQTMESYLACKDFCYQFGLKAAAVEAASFCFCLESYTASLAASTSCGSLCVDGSECGGEDGNAILKLLDSSTPIVAADPPKYIEITLNDNVTEVTVNQAVTVTVNASNATNFITDWNDGAGPVDNTVTSKSYALPGIYEIKAVLLDDATLSDSVYVTVYDGPEVFVECPELLEINIPSECNITSTRQGYDFNLTYNTVATGTDPEFAAFMLPGEDIKVYGGTAATPSGTTDLSTGNLVILPDSSSSRKGYITRIKGNFPADGPIDIYGVVPTCTGSGETYCGILEQCSSSTCPLPTEGAFSCSSTFCSIRGTCSEGATCSVLSNSYGAPYTAQHIGTIGATSGAYDQAIEPPLAVPAGSLLAFGCRDSSGCPATNYRANGAQEKADILIDSSGNVLTSASVHDFQIVVRGHSHIELKKELLCTANAPKPNSEIADLTAATVEQHIHEGNFSFTLEMSSAFVGSTVTNSSNILCQEKILPPTLSSLDRWIKLGTVETLTVTFTQGSPIFANITVDQTVIQHYWDDAKASPLAWQFDLNYSQEGYFLLEGQANNLLNTVLFSAEIHIVPPVTDTWTLTFVQPCYTNYDCQMIIAFPSAPNPPWNATVNATYSGGELVSIGFRDFETVNGSGVAKELSIENVVQLSEPGLYPVTVTLVNEVSNTTITADLLMTQAIEGVSSEITWSSAISENDTLMGTQEDTAMIKRAITVTPTTVKGTPDVWQVILTSDNGTSTVHNLTGSTHTFELPQEGKYTVVVQGYNPVQGWIQSTPKDIFGIDRIKGLKLATDDTIYKPMENTSIFLEYDAFPMTACLIINYNDNSTMEKYGSKETCDDPRYEHAKYIGPVTEQPFEVKHNYTEMNVYNVSVLAFDDKGEVRVDASITVADLPCKTPIVTILEPYKYPESGEQNMKSKPFTKSALTENRCNKTMPNILKYWEVVKVNATFGTEIEEKRYIEDLDSWTQPTLTLPKLRLEYGTYKLTFRFKIIALPTVYLEASDFTFLEIIKSPLVASIIEGGATQIKRGFGQTVNLDCTIQSHDPDDVEDKNFNITWLCRELNSPVTFIDSENGSLNVFNYHAIPESLQAIKERRTGGGCFGVGDGALEYTDGLLELDTGSFVKQAGFFEMWVQIQKDTRTAFQKIVIEVTKYPPPTVSIACAIGSCYPSGAIVYVNKGARLPLTGNCLQSCGTSRKHEWTIRTQSGIPIIEDNEPCVSATTNSDGSGSLESKEDVCNSVYRSYKDDTSFILSENFFGVNSGTDTFVIRYNTIVTSDVPPSSGYSEKIFVVNTPPKDGSCTIDKKDGVSLIEYFYLECTGWVDKELHKVKDYVAYYVKEGKETILATNSFPQFNLKLPDGVLDVKVNVSDELGAITTYDVGQINASVPTKADLDAYDMEADIAKLQLEGDTQTINLIYNALLSLKNNPDSPTAVNLEVISELNDEEKNEAFVALSEQNKDTVKVLSDMNVNSVSQATTIAEQLSMIYQLGGNDTELKKLMNDVETKNLTISACYDLITKVIELGFTLDQAAPLIGSMLDITTAVRTSNKELLLSPNKTAPPSDILNSMETPSEFEITEDTELAETTLGQLTNSALQRTRRLVEENERKINQIFLKATVSILEKMVPGETFETSGREGDRYFLFKVSEPKLKNGFRIVAGEGEHKAIIDLPENLCPTEHIMQVTDCKNDIGIVVQIIPCQVHITVDSIRRLGKGSHVVDFSIFYNGKKIPIANEKVPIGISVPLKRIPLPASDVMDSTGDMSTVQPFVYSKFENNNLGSSLVLKIYEITKLPPNTIILLSHNSIPTVTSFTYKIMYSKFTRHSNGLSSYFLNDMFFTNTTGNYTIGVGVAKSETIANKKFFEQSDFSRDFVSKFRIEVHTAACYYFDELRKEWSPEKLTIRGSEELMTYCSTRHLSSFGSGFFPSPNKLNFSYIFANIAFLDNLSLYVFLIVLGSFFIIMMIWAHFMDRKDDERKCVIPLPDNQPQDKYLYEIAFHTGSDKEATTESQIMFMASGDYGETEVRILPTSTNHLYRRYDVNYFVMSTSGPLGGVNYLRVLHDNSGEPPLDSWQIEKVEVRDLQTSEKFTFDIDAWLAFDRDAGKIDRTFTRSFTDQRDFSTKMYYNSNKATNQDHIFISMFFKPIGSRYTRKERVMVCAAFLFLSMLLSVMWYERRPETDVEGIFSLGAFTLSSEAIMTGLVILVIVYPIIYLISLIFKRARPRNLLRCRAIESVENQRSEQFMNEGLSYSDAERKSKVQLRESGGVRMKEYSKVRCLPWWTRVLGWLILLATIGASAFFVWSYGIMFGETKTVQCLSAFLLSFFMAIIVIQWFNIICIGCFASVFCEGYFANEETDCDEEIPAIKLENSWLHKEPLDPYQSKWIQQVEGVDDEDPEIITLRTKLTKDREMKSVVRGIMLYCVFLAILTIIISFKMNANYFHLQNHLKKTFIKQGHLDYDFAEKIKTSDDWWMWCRNVIVQELRAYTYYNEKPAVDAIGYLDDKQNRIMGHAILRQVRSRRNKCLAPYPLRDIVGRCSGIRGVNSEDDTNYCAGWFYNSSFEGACFMKEFQYQTSNKLETFGSTARLGSYGGGGYVFRLKPVQSKLFEKMNILQENHWIDQNTRAIFLEFSVYNVNLNLFAVCQIVAEFMEGGGIIPYWRFDVLKLSPDDGFWGDVNTVCELLFVVSIAIFTLNEFWKMKRDKCKYFDSYWNLAELIILGVSYTIIGLYFYRNSLVDEALQKFYDKAGNTYVRMDSAALVEQIFLTMLAIVLFFSFLKLIKFLQFNNRMNMLAFTIKGCWDELKVFFIAFGFVFFAFSSLFYFMFILYLEEFSSIYKAVQTSFKMMMGKFDFQAMKDSNPLSPLLFFVFSVFNSMILINIMLTMILQSFKTVKTAMENKENRLNVIDYIWSQFRQTIRVERRPKIHVEPKLRERKEHQEIDLGNNQTNELPGKVNQLLRHVNEVYFEGKLNLNDPKTKQNFMGQNGLDEGKGPMNLGARKISQTD